MNDATPATQTPAERYRTPRQQAVVGLFRATDGLRRRFTRLLEPWGLTTQQYNVLRILRGALPAPLPTMEIAERMLEQTPGVTRLLDRLAEKGLAGRERCVEDRRQVLCSITAAGLGLLEQLDDRVAEEDEAALGMLSDAEVRQLNRLLGRLRAGEE